MASYARVYEYFSYETGKMETDINPHYDDVSREATLLFVLLPEHFEEKSLVLDRLYSDYICDTRKPLPKHIFEVSDNVFTITRREGDQMVIKNRWTDEELRLPIVGSESVSEYDYLDSQYQDE